MHRRCPLPVMTKPPPEAINVPIKLPRGFKNKQKLVRPSTPLKEEVRDQLYITDNKKVYEWASKKTFIFRIFKLYYWAYRWTYDAFGLSPTWHSVMYVDDIIKDNKLIHVTDTLVLHIDTISSFEKLIPFICGPFTRLTIHGGDIKLDQLKRLMRDTVRKVEITAQIQLKHDECDDAVRLISQHVRGFRYVFNLKSTPELITKLKPIVKINRYLHVQNPKTDDCDVIHWTAHWFDIITSQCSIAVTVWFFARLIAAMTKHKGTQSIQISNHQCTLDSASESHDLWSSKLSLFLTIFLIIVTYVLGLPLGSKPDF